MAGIDYDCAAEFDVLGDGAVTPRTIQIVQAIAWNASRRSYLDIEDLTQEGLVAAWQAADKWNGFGDINGWIAISSQRAILDYIRRVEWNYRRKSARPHFVRVPDHVLGHADSDGPQSAEVEKVLQIIRRAKMPQAWRDALLETTLGDMTQVEYAAVVGLSRGRVSRMVAEATERVRERAYHV